MRARTKKAPKQPARLYLFGIRHQLDGTAWANFSAREPLILPCGREVCTKTRKWRTRPGREGTCRLWLEGVAGSLDLTQISDLAAPRWIANDKVVLLFGSPEPASYCSLRGAILVQAPLDADRQTADAGCGAPAQRS
ncbi:hypothetical protein [Bradyrhizobium yuanmingense]|uniref:hypothetical protein n=1 Tax=Bradyrhizobium yuanmingense TaxID=108015 RepID=UPI003519424A